MSLVRAKWQHYQNPKTGKWDAQAHKSGRVIGNTAGQGHNRMMTCLNAVESMSGSRESTLVEFKDRVRSPK